MSNRPPTKEEEFYLKWARENLKISITRVNELQKSLFQTNTTLLGGSIIFNQFLDGDWKFAFITCGTASMIISFMGTLSFEHKFYEDIPESVKSSKKKQYLWKKRFYYASAFITFLTMLVGLAGVFLKIRM